MTCEHKWIEDYNPATGTRYRCKRCGEVRRMFDARRNVCTFDKAWIGPCGKQDCKEHKGISCSCCGAPATRECAETFGFVCGSPLCDTCEHELTADGVNYSGCKHVRRGKQKHAPWFVQSLESTNL